jgi:hypothetical protein
MNKELAAEIIFGINQSISTQNEVNGKLSMILYFLSKRFVGKNMDDCIDFVLYRNLCENVFDRLMYLNDDDITEIIKNVACAIADYSTNEIETVEMIIDFLSMQEVETAEKAKMLICMNLN